MMMALMLMLASDVHVRTGDGCATVDNIRSALEAAEIDPSESVTVTLVANASVEEPHRIFVDAQLIGVTPMHREATLRMVECADVPALMVVWLGQHRNDGANSVFAQMVTPPAKPPTAKPVVPDPAPRKVIAAVDEDEWSPFNGPPPCGNFRAGTAIGASADGPLLVLDTAWQLAAPWGVAAGLGLTASAASVFPSGFVGALYSAAVGPIEVSGRGALAFGQTNVVESVVAPVDEGECPPSGTIPRTIDQNLTKLFLGPRLSVRGRWTWGYTEVGAVWQLGADLTPKVFAIVGVQLFGI